MKQYILFFLVTLAAVTLHAQKPKAVKAFQKASKELDNGHMDKALVYLAKAVKIDPKYGTAYALRAFIYEKKNDSSNAIKAHRKTLECDPYYQSNYYYFAKYLYELGRYDEALQQLENFNSITSEPKFNPKKDKSSAKIVSSAVRLKETCLFAKEESATQSALNIKNMGYGINSKYHEYWPGMTIDGKYFIYTRLVDGQEDFYLSSRADTGWSKSISLPGKINTVENEGTTSLTPDGKFIFFTVCNQDGFGGCDLFYSRYNASNNSWSQRSNLGAKINSALWDAQPAIGADGKTIIFASARPGGYGGKDLWLSHFTNGEWTVPENLGKDINTSDDEEAPFLHYDGKTLYFASSGHPGLGGHDLFLSRKNSEGGWSKPINLGRGINTDADEMGLYVEYGGEKAYFSSSRSGGLGGIDIYSFDLAPDKRPGPISYVLGKVLDAETQKEITGKIEVYDLNTNAIVLRDSANSFFTTLEPGGNYSLNVYRQGYLFYSANFQPVVAKIDSPFVVTALLNPIKNDVTIILNNIFFDVDKFDIKSESFAELDVVLKLLRSNPGIKIEISGHTDNTGSADHNQILSENRAKEVQQYLQTKSIAKNRISYKGYGASQPIASNDTESGKAKNRRIEMRVTGI